MKNCWATVILVLFTGLLGQTVQAQHPPAETASRPQAAAGQERLGPGTVVLSELMTALDVRKLHVGDTFEARVSSDVRSADRTLLPRDARLFGRVLQVQRRSKSEPESLLLIVMEKAILQDGKEIPLAAALRGFTGSRGDAGNNAPSQRPSLPAQDASRRTPDSAHPGSTWEENRQAAGNARDPFSQPEWKSPRTAPSTPSRPPLPRGGLRTQTDSSGRRVTLVYSPSDDVKIDRHTLITWVVE